MAREADLRTELRKLTANELIDLLLLPPNEQKNEQLHNIKVRLDNTDKQLPGNAPNDTKNEGGNDKHLQELMRDYEDKEQIKFDFYKLFLLIPKSTYCPTTLEEASSRIQKSRPLEEKLLTRAGVQQRSYKNSVYKIVNGDKVTYVVAEFATPVKTYKDVMTYNYGEQSEAYEKNKDKVVEKFHETLQNILWKHENCTEFCELVIYDDKDARGKLRDLADVLMDKIDALKREEGAD